nr:hypothetical protein CFP56_21132 [Quercus suber]
MLFINRQAESSQAPTQRALLTRAYRRRSDESTHSQDFCQATFSHVEQLRTLSARRQISSSLIKNTAILSAKDIQLYPTYRALVHEFEPRHGSGGIFGADRINVAGSKHYSSVALCIRSLLPLALLDIPILDDSIFSLICIYYGKLHADFGLVELSLSIYTDTLRQFHAHLRNSTSDTDRSAMAQQELMCASLALAFFEIIAEIDVYGSGQMAHFDAAMRSLEHCGPESLQSSPASQLLFNILADASVHMDIHRRYPSFLTESEWLAVRSNTIASTSKTQLFRLGSEIPYFLKSADTLQSDLHASRLTQEQFVVRALTSIEEFAALNNKFDLWRHDLRKSAQSPLYWSRSKPMIQHIGLTDQECVPKYTNRFHQLLFRSSPDAGLLAHSWAFQLELLMTLTDIQHALLNGPLLETQRSEITNAMGKACDAAAQLAHLVLEAEPYLSSCFEGLLCLQSPLMITKKYFVRQLHI